MKRALLTFLLSGVLCVPAFAQLDEAEQAFIQKCYDNVDKAKKQLSPDTAKECVTKLNAGNAALLNKLHGENPGVAAEIVAYNNALVDLKRITAGNKGKDLGMELARVLDRENCALCDLDLGPRPESMFGWVGEKAGGRLFDVKKSVRTWEALGEIRVNSLSRAEYGYSGDKWNAQAIQKRYESLSGWAQKETDNLAAFAALPDKAPGAAAYIAKMVSTLREDLVFPADAPYHEKLNKLAYDSSKAGDAPAAPKSPADGKKAKELAASSEKFAALKGQSALSQQDQLNKTFDNAAVQNDGGLAGGGSAAGGLAGGADEKAFKPVPITQEQAGLLSSKMAVVKDGKLTGYLADEIKGTKAGDEIAGFFSDPKYDKTEYNKLNLKFEKGEGSHSNALGWWDSGARTTTVNTKMVDEYLARNKITPEQLLSSDASLKGLATYIAPNFVHETTHQRQDAWSRANGLDYIKYKGGITGAPYQMEMETEAFSMQAAFSAEKAKKLGPGYLSQISYSHRVNAERFMEDGVDALRTGKKPLYTSIDSMEGSAAREFKAARETANHVAALEQKNRTNPAAMTGMEKANLEYYRGKLNTRFKWYTMVYQKSAADEAKLLAWRDSFEDDGAMLSAPPPAL